MENRQKIFKEEFDVSAFADTYYGNTEYDLRWVVEDFYHNLFSQGKLPGKTVVDVGCGPTMRGATVASKYVSEIYNADLLEESLNFVMKWIRNEADAFDFSKGFTHVAHLEGHGDLKCIEERVRRSIKEFLICDIFRENPFHPEQFRQFDVVLSSFLLDSFPNEDDYMKGVKGIASLVKPGGHVALVGALNSKNYALGGKILENANVNGTRVKNSFTQAGLKVLEVCEIERDKELVLDDFKGVITMYAKKT